MHPLRVHFLVDARGIWLRQSFVARKPSYIDYVLCVSLLTRTSDNAKFLFNLPCHQRKNIPTRGVCFFVGGRERARTSDLYHVKVAL